MDLKFENWKFLQQRLFTSEAHKRLEVVFSQRPEVELSRLFRNHNEPGNEVSDPEEVSIRLCADEWLAEVSLLFLGWLSGYASSTVDTPQAESILAILGHRSMRPYYESHYPVALPWLFRQQLQGELQIEPEQAPGAFEYFINLYERFKNDRELICFLNFLDGYQFGRGEATVGIETVADAFSNPDRIVDAIFKPKPQATALDEAIIGLLRFATFSTTLHEFLLECESMPMLQSGFWFFYAFWYREFKKDVKEVSVRAIQRASANVYDKGSQALASQSEQELDEIMTALTDGRYSNALIEIIPNETLGSLSFEIGLVSAPVQENEWVSRFSAYKNSSAAE